MSDQVNEEIEKLQEPALATRLSKRHAGWETALHGGDAALLEYLVLNDDPAAAPVEFETYINGIYRGSLHPLSMPKTEIKSKAARVLPYMTGGRGRLGWCIREFDLGLLRLIHRSSALSPVLGAGVLMGAGVPSWSGLVQFILGDTLDKGLELYESVPAADNPAQLPIEFLPDGTVPTGCRLVGRSSPPAS